MIENTINRLNGEIEAVKLEAMQKIREQFNDIKSEGEGIYSSGILGGNGAVLWLGIMEVDGDKTGGGLFYSKAYIGGYKIEAKYSNIEGSENKYINVSAEITEISRDELIDLLYDEKQRQLIKNLGNDE